VLDDSPSTQARRAPTPTADRHSSLIERCRTLATGSLARIDRCGSVSQVTDIGLPEELFGWRTPRSWHGVAIVLGGRADTGDRVETGVTLGALALASGDCVAWADVADRTLAESSDPIGLVPDTCRRALGLASHPDHPRIGELANLRWLSEILHLAADPTTATLVTEWDAISALHPVAEQRPGEADEADEDLALRPAELEELTAWSQLHALGSRVGWEELEPHQVSWMDPPMFARWTVGSHRPLSEMVRDLSLFLPSHLLGAVCAVLLEPVPPR